MVRYIAGYVVLKLKKMFSLHSSFFDQVVATSYGDLVVSSLDEYSRIWTKQVDRQLVNLETLKALGCGIPRVLLRA